MSLIVQKYGGTSVADPERIRNVARRVLATQKACNDVVVVLSAMAGRTNELIAMAGEMQKTPDPREMDVLLATGEQTTVALFAMAVKEMGSESRSFLGMDIPIITDNSHGKARILDIGSDRLMATINDGAIPVVAGFQGVTDDGDITTLGRGGSDTTAVAVAAAIKADMCEIYTDVDGVYTTDPRICDDARKIRKISYEEMLEMASLGAKVLEIRSVEFAMRHGIPVHVRSSFNDNTGTIVMKEDETMEDILVSGVTYSREEARITISKVPDRPGIASAIFKPVSDANIIVDMIIQNTRAGDMTDMTFTVPRGDFNKTMSILKGVAREIGAESVTGDDSIAKISVIGVGMRNHSGVASRMFDALARENINVSMISTSEIKISCVIEEKYIELAVRTLHDEFNLDREPVKTA